MVSARGTATRGVGDGTVYNSFNSRLWLLSQASLDANYYVKTTVREGY
jgi:hypothetical protein